MQDEPHDKAFQAWLKENRTIACPTCGQGLQKQEGCNHLQYVPWAFACPPVPIGLTSVASRFALICPLPAAHCCLSVGLFAQCCVPPVPSAPPPPVLLTTPLSHALHSIHLQPLAFSCLPPAVAITFWAFATLGTSTALKITCLFGKLAYCCLVHSSCAAPDL